MMSTDEYRDLKASLDERFTNVDERFTKVDEHFTRVDERFTKVDERFTKVDERFTKVDEQLTKIDERFTQLETRLSEEIRTAAAQTRHHFDVVAEDLKSTIRVVAEGHGHHATVLDDHEARLQRLEQGRLRFDA
jgi:chromosome segregation ATPase